MIKKLIKLADRLDATGYLDAANRVDEIISKFSSSMDPPHIFEAGGNIREKDLNGEFEFPDRLEHRTEIQMLNEVSPELESAAKKYLNSIGYSLRTIEWKTKEELSDLKLNSEPCWYATSTPLNPEDMPINWCLREVSPGDPGYEIAAPIEGQRFIRLYGES